MMQYHALWERLLYFGMAQVALRNQGAPSSDALGVSEKDGGYGAAQAFTSARDYSVTTSMLGGFLLE